MNGSNRDGERTECEVKKARTALISALCKVKLQVPPGA